MEQVAAIDFLLCVFDIPVHKKLLQCFHSADSESTRHATCQRRLRKSSRLQRALLQVLPFVFDLTASSVFLLGFV